MTAENKKKIKIMQFKLELADYKPKMRRTLQVAENISAEDFCYIVMKAFNCYAAYHLYALNVGNGEDEIRYQIEYPESDFWENDREIKGVKLKDIFKEVGDTAVLNYDFGDNWEFKCELEKSGVEVEADKKEFPKILDGKGYGIIEDCGGIYGLKDIEEFYAEKKFEGLPPDSDEETDYKKSGYKGSRDDYDLGMWLRECIDIANTEWLEQYGLKKMNIHALNKDIKTTKDFKNVYRV
jgi:hypothetical protein